MSTLGISLAILTILAGGAGLTLLLWRKPEPILIAELFGCSWFFGAGVVSMTIAAAGTILSGTPLFVFTLTVVAALAFCGFWRWRTKYHVALALDSDAGWQRWIGVLALLLPVSYMALNTYRDAISWDGLFIWESKARYAFFSGGSLPASYFADATRTGDHPNYPLFLPMSEVWVYLWIGDCDQTALKPLFPIFYAAGLALLWSTALRLSGRLWIAALCALISLFVPLMVDHGLGLMQGYADFMLGCVYLAALGALLAWGIKGLESGWMIACAFGAILPWVKQEGMFLLASLVVQAALLHGKRRWRQWILFCLPGIAVLAVWKIALRCVHVVESADFTPITPAALSANISRAPLILEFMGHQLLLLTKWSLLWYLVPPALACLAWQRRREWIFLGLALLIPLSLDVVPFIFSRLEIMFHLGSSMDRLILQLSLVAVLAIGLALDGKRKKEDV